MDSYADNHGLGSKLKEKIKSDEKAAESKVVALDKFISGPVHFIKADIESYEYDMILGSSNIIKNYQPMIAVCIYHNAADFFQIPLLLQEINPNYKFAVRHHSFDLVETVLYAWA